MQPPSKGPEKVLPSALQDPHLPAHLASRPCLRRLPCPHDWLCPAAPSMPTCAPLPRPASHPQGAPNMPSAHAPAQFLLHPAASPPHLLTSWASTRQPTITGAFRGPSVSIVGALLGPPSPTAPRSRQASGAQPLCTSTFRAARQMASLLPHGCLCSSLRGGPSLSPWQSQHRLRAPCTPQPPPSPCHHPSRCRVTHVCG